MRFSLVNAYKLHVSRPAPFVGLAMSGTTFVVALGAVGRIVPAEHRSTAFGIVTAGGSLGQFAVVPAAQMFITNFGWRGMLFASAVLVLVNLIAAFGFRMPKAVAAPANSPPQRLRAALDAAARHPHYWLLNGGFFVCGFHVAFVGTHLPAYLVDGGLDVSIGAWSLALIGLFNIVGSYLFGVWGGKYSRPGLLTALYAARGVAIVAFIAVPLSPASALLFAAAFGFLWLGTVPLTNGAVASMFGVTHLSTLAGVVFLSHQVGAFLGAWFGGLLFDRTGSYDLVWYASIALAVLAAILSAMTRDAPVRTPALAAA
jgi:predicted MFS family arabinose efflux permease